MTSCSILPHHISNPSSLSYSQVLYMLICLFISILNLSDYRQNFVGFVIVDLQWRVCRSLFGGDGGGVVGGFALLGFCKRRFGHFEQFRSAAGRQQRCRDNSDGEQRCLKSSERQFLSSHNFKEFYWMTTFFPLWI